jgi:hypothetical protein
MRDPSLAKLGRLAALAAAALCLSAAGAWAESHQAAAAVHTATPAIHGTHVRHHFRHHRGHPVARHELSASRVPASNAPAPARTPAPASPRERKATLPTSVHAQRHSPGSSHKHRHTLASALLPGAMTVRSEVVTPDSREAEPTPHSILRPGRAPPRAGPSTDLAVPPPSARPHSFQPAASASPTRSEFQTAALPPGEAFSRVHALTLPYPVLKPEQPSGRSRADRFEGAAAWRTMPS